MRISDWSSAVCSSDLVERRRRQPEAVGVAIGVEQRDDGFDGLSVVVGHRRGAAQAKQSGVRIVPVIFGQIVAIFIEPEYFADTGRQFELRMLEIQALHKWLFAPQRAQPGERKSVV